MTDESKPDNPPAFPSGVEYTDEATWEPRCRESCHLGMALLDYFAAQALVSLMKAEFVLGTTKENCLPFETRAGAWASLAYIQADAMLRERQRRMGQ